MADFLPKFSLNQNKLAEVLDLVFDLERKQKKELPEILKELDLDLSTCIEAERADKLRALLKSKRYPFYEGKKQKSGSAKKEPQSNTSNQPGNNSLF